MRKKRRDTAYQKKEQVSMRMKRRDTAYLKKEQVSNHSSKVLYNECCDTYPPRQISLVSLSYLPVVTGNTLFETISMVQWLSPKEMWSCMDIHEIKISIIKNIKHFRGDIPIVSYMPILACKINASLGVYSYMPRSGM